MYRRRVLGAAAAALTGVTAGCSGSGGSGGAEPTDEATATATETAAATATATPTETATATGTPTEVEEAVGDPFTVGEGENAFGVTVREFLRADALGPTQNEEATNTYLIVVLTVENPTGGSIGVPSGQMRLRAEGIIRNVDANASEALGGDRRIDADPIASASIPSGESVTGAVVYDAETGVDFRFTVSPSGPGQVHTVPVGDVADATQLTSGY